MNFNLKFDQLALVCETRPQQQRLGDKYHCAVVDEVETQGLNYLGQVIKNRARLMFSYEIWPMEFEILHYMSGWNWHNDFLHNVDGTPPLFGALSHFGVHVPDLITIDLWRPFYPVLQEVVTTSHTNPAIADKRRYHYVIFDTRLDFGTCVKFIRRMEVDEGEQFLKKLLEKHT